MLRRLACAGVLGAVAMTGLDEPPAFAAQTKVIIQLFLPGQTASFAIFGAGGATGGAMGGVMGGAAARGGVGSTPEKAGGTRGRGASGAAAGRSNRGAGVSARCAGAPPAGGIGEAGREMGGAAGGAAGAGVFVASPVAALCSPDF